MGKIDRLFGFAHRFLTHSSTVFTNDASLQRTSQTFFFRIPLLHPIRIFLYATLSHFLPSLNLPSFPPFLCRSFMSETFCQIEPNVFHFFLPSCPVRLCPSVYSIFSHSFSLPPSCSSLPSTFSTLSISSFPLVQFVCIFLSLLNLAILSPYLLLVLPFLPRSLSAIQESFLRPNQILSTSSFRSFCPACS